MPDAEPAVATATLLAQGGGGGAIVPSINPATTYARDRDTYAPIDGRIYSRDHCPNYELPEQTLAALEGAQGCLLFSSGIAAADALLRALLRPGDCLVLPRLGYFAIRKHAAARTCPPLELGRTDLQTG
jgi:cystathionine gamma-synthase